MGSLLEDGICGRGLEGLEGGLACMWERAGEAEGLACMWEMVWRNGDGDWDAHRNESGKGTDK